MWDSLWSHGPCHTRLLCLPLSPGVSSNSCLLSQWHFQTISLSVVSFSSYPQSFLAWGCFPVSSLFAPGGWSIRTSASVLLMNIQDWFPLGLTGLNSLLSKGFSRIFSSTIIQKHHFFGAQPSLWSTLTSVHDYWKNRSFDNMNFCQQNDLSAFQYTL